MTISNYYPKDSPTGFHGWTEVESSTLFKTVLDRPSLPQFKICVTKTTLPQNGLVLTGCPRTFRLDYTSELGLKLTCKTSVDLPMFNFGPSSA